jgi:hypothetical protein
VNSIRENGWEKGSLLGCTNRGKKGGAPIFAVGEGRSRLKAVRIVNAERVEAGLPPIRPQFILMTEDEAYEAMHASHNKQERKPTFEARCWAQHKRIFALERFGKAALEDSEVSDARKAYAKLRKCTNSQIRIWDQMLSAHPEVLRMFDAGERGLNRTALLDIVNSTAYADQPEAARKIVAMAKARKEDAPTSDPAVEAAPVMQTESSNVVTPEAEEPKATRGARSERADRRAALGIDAGPKMLSVKKLSALAAQFSAVEDPELVDPRVMLAYVLGQSEFDGIRIEDHPSMVQVMKMAKRGGAK